MSAIDIKANKRKAKHACKFQFRTPLGTSLLLPKHDNLHVQFCSFDIFD